MVPGKGKYGIVSKGKGAHSKSGSATKSKEIKRERISDTEDSDEETVTLPDLRLLDYVKCLPRFTASKYITHNLLFSLFQKSSFTINFTLFKATLHYTCNIV